MRHREREEKVQDIAREKKGTRHKEREQKGQDIGREKKMG